MQQTATIGIIIVIRFTPLSMERDILMLYYS